MKNKLIGLLLKWSGAGWVWDKLDGNKTKIGGAASILSGAGGLLAQLVPLISARDFSALLAWAQNLPNDPSWQLLVVGLGILGVGHKLEKAAPKTEEKPAP